MTLELLVVEVEFEGCGGTQRVEADRGSSYGSVCSARARRSVSCRLMLCLRSWSYLMFGGVRGMGESDGLIATNIIVRVNCSSTTQYA